MANEAAGGNDPLANTGLTATEGGALAAARLLAGHWQSGRHLDALPLEWRPATADEGRAVQALWGEVTGQRIAGWKIAATSTAGQQHIAVGGPLAGPVFERHVLADGAGVSLAANGMRVAECEIVFGIGHRLAPRTAPYTRAEVLAAVRSLHPGIEVPDSRFRAFERAGEAQLIADCACCNDMLVGAAVAPDARVDALPSLQVQARVSDGRCPQGIGSNVLGDPVQALVWLVNELASTGRTLEAGQFVTTGACVPPIPVLPGQAVEADFGWIGRIGARFV
jgi:2-keto-4-pentenoate hydratase